MPGRITNNTCSVYPGISLEKMDELFGVTQLWEKQADAEQGPRTSAPTDNKPTAEIEEHKEDNAAQKE